MITPSKGTLLIANPFLQDPNFSRCVVFICEHMEEGTFGFVLSRPFDFRLNELVPDLESITLPVYMGGPVQQDSLHFLHQYPDDIPGGVEVAEGVFWGGNFESLKAHLINKDLNSGKIRFFIGYSGWSEGQLGDEMKQDSWLTLKATRRLLFDTQPTDTWKESLKLLGGQYADLVHYPTDPRLN